MTTSTPPSVYFNGITFNPTYFEDATQTITKKEADSRYLIKTVSDTTTLKQNFLGGINCGASSVTTNKLYADDIHSEFPDVLMTIGNLQTVGLLDIGCGYDRTGEINIANTKNTNTAQSINIGSNNALATGQVININRPLTIGYTVSPSLLTQIGGTAFNTGSAIVYTATGSKTLATLSSIPIGIYQVFYSVSTAITGATTILTEQTTTISNATNNTTSGAVLNLMSTSEYLHVTRIVGHNMTITGGGILVNTTASNTIYLNQRFVFTALPTLTCTGHVRIVRIG
jgi:hypothetical protein